MIWAISFVSLVIAGLTIAVGMHRGGILSPMTLFGAHCLLGIALRAIILSVNEIPPDTFLAVLFRVATLNREVSLLELVLAQTCVLGGYFMLSRASGQKIARTVGVPFQALPGKQARMLFLGIFAFSWVAFFAFVVMEFGSLSQAFFMLQKRALLFGSDVAIARKFVLVAAAALAFYSYALAKAPGGMTTARKLWWLGLVGFHVVVMFLTGSRGATLTHLLIFTFVMWSSTGFRQVKLTFQKVMGVAIAAPVVIAVVLGGMAYRVSAQTGVPVGDALAQTAARAPVILSATFPLVDLFYAAKQFTISEGHDNGVQYLNNALRFVPRDLWPDKPETIGVQMRQYYYGDKLSAVPPTVFGEFYIAFGIVSLVIGSILFGMILNIAAGLQREARHSPGLSPLYIVVLMQLTFGVVKSGFENSLFTMIYFLATFALLSLMVRLVGQGHSRRLSRAVPNAVGRRA